MTTDAAASSRRNSGVRRMWPNPASRSARQCLGWGTGLASRRRIRESIAAAITNVTASKTLTIPPPTRANRAAPKSGDTSRPASWNPRLHPFNSCRRSRDSITAKSASSAGLESVKWMPYQVITAKMIQAEPGPLTARTGRTSAAETRFRPTRNRRRRTRSATTPASGPARDGA